MGQFFAGNYTGPAFQLFGVAHIGALLFLVGLNIFLVQFKNSSEATKRSIRWTLAIILWVSEISWHIWNLYWGYWSNQFMLPLNVCSVLIWLSGFMLIFKNRQIYEFAYFLGITACANYLLTPDLGIYGFPAFSLYSNIHLRSPGITAAIYMTTAEAFDPTWKSMWKILLGGEYLYGRNILYQPASGSNYVLVNVKPTDNQHPELHVRYGPITLFIIELIGIAYFCFTYRSLSKIGGRGKFPLHRRK